MKPVGDNSAYRICIVGSLLGKRNGFITMQGFILSQLFIKEGFRVTSASGAPNIYLRMLDIVFTMFFRAGRYDIVMIDIYSSRRSMFMQFVEAKTAKLLGKKIIMFLHGGNLPEYAKNHERSLRGLLDKADFIASPSGYLANFGRSFGFTVTIIPNVIELGDYNYIHRKSVGPKLFWMRNFHPTWNPLMAIRVVNLLKKDYPDVTLDMAGPDKGMRAECEALVKELGLGQQISFPGFLDKSQKKPYFDNNDIYLNTNIIDNTPLALIEACASGLPVVSTNVGGVPYLFKNGENALLVESDNVQEMADAVKKLIGDSALASKLSENGRQFALTYSWGNVREQWKNVFDKLLAPSR